MNEGERIIEERKRLGLSQQAFASAAGVSLSSQKRYENGERKPDYSFELLEKIGADPIYIYSGSRYRKDLVLDYPRAYQSLLDVIVNSFGLDSKAATEFVQERAILDAKYDQCKRVAIYGDWHSRAFHWICSAESLDVGIDDSLLASTLDAVEQAAVRLGVSLSTRQRLVAAFLLYRDAMRNRKDDPAIDDVSELFKQDEIDEHVQLISTLKL